MSPAQPLPAPLDSGAAGRPTRFGKETDLAPGVLERLRSVCGSVSTSAEDRVRGGRDWWPLSTVWATGGRAPALPAAVVRPGDTAEVSAVLAVCDDARVPVTPVAGASGVCGGSVPLFGGISLDMTALDGVVDVDDRSLLVRVRAGTFGDGFEEELRSGHDLTLGHWPQSIALSTVGGWVACRSAGQYSTRYGKIEDMVAGLEVVLADGRVIRTGGTAPRSATGPDLTQLFVGSEGILGVITEVELKVHPRPPAQRMAAFGWPSFEAGLDACRRVLRRGATPAVLRLYDEVESKRNFDAASNVLLVVDEGDPGLVDAVMAVVGDECAAAEALPSQLADKWLDHRNEIPDVASLVAAGIVVDTVEVSGSWKALPAIYQRATAGLQALPATLAASAHQSHAYTDGGCLYFTFAGRPGGDEAEMESYYRQAFDAVTAATLSSGGSLSHHHGIGLNRGGYMPDYLGSSFAVLEAVKAALDPHGTLNPGKLGLSR